jgi:hypothetical protein
MHGIFLIGLTNFVGVPGQAAKPVFPEPRFPYGEWGYANHPI